MTQLFRTGNDSIRKNNRAIGFPDSPMDPVPRPNLVTHPIGEQQTRELITLAKKIRSWRGTEETEGLGITVTRRGILRRADVSLRSESEGVFFQTERGVATTNDRTDTRGWLASRGFMQITEGGLLSGFAMTQGAGLDAGRFFTASGVPVHMASSQEIIPLIDKNQYVTVSAGVSSILTSQKAKSGHPLAVYADLEEGGYVVLDSYGVKGFVLLMPGTRNTDSRVDTEAARPPAPQVLAIN